MRGESSERHRGVPHHCAERPQQLHIDLTVTDMDKAEQQVLEIGATKHEHQPSEDDSFRVFLDPTGHPFCLCRD
ncbi:VOC family protein [Nonomuraea sp. NPDC050786]|uniref:VOC family protein n=1 Tax=Nonomuraea sp. NPDC050786 TaxID=3154840 RepID=UPI0033CAFE69